MAQGDSAQLNDFESIKSRLEEIVEAVSDDTISLDDALDLYEEAVTLGMRVSETLEEGIEVDEAALDDEETAAHAGSAFSGGVVPDGEGAVS